MAAQIPGPSTPPPDPTHTHLLSLPPLLHPISPSLAALHMARVRLLLDIPASTSVGIMSEWWCHACGGLREGVGGAGPKRRVSRGVGKAKRGGGGAKGKGKGKRGIVDGSRLQEPTLGSAVGKRKAAECVNCGERFGKPKPDKATLITYPSARIAARTRRSVAVASEGAGPSVSGTTASALAPSTHSNEAGPSSTPLNGFAPTLAASTLSTTMNQHTTSQPDPLPNDQQQPHPPVPTPSKPNFTRVKTTEPNLPTYPPPASSTSPEKGASKKRKKKSGLAKLLAENKERAAAQNMGGTWGLG